jgi:hypothetical protein
MELSWLTRIKIGAVMVLGIAIWGIYLWSFAAPHDPMGAVTVANFSAAHIGITFCAAFAVGFIAYFIGWPYGREIGIIAVPAGLAAWAARSGNMGELMQTHSSISERLNQYRIFGWEGFLWLAVAAAGYAGTISAASIVKSSGVLAEFGPDKTKAKLNIWSLLGLAVSAVIAGWGISLFAKDVVFPDKNIGHVIGQAANGQAAFASLVSFGIAAFIIKKLWGASYIWPAISTAIVVLIGMNLCGRVQMLDYMAKTWPAVFYRQPNCGLLPIQIVSFGILGSIAGYWLAVRFKYWQENHAK